MIRILTVVSVIQFIALGFGGWLLWGQIEKGAQLEQSVTALTKANQDKTNATKGRNQTERDVRSMAPADKLNRLRGRSTPPQR